MVLTFVVEQEPDDPVGQTASGAGPSGAAGDPAAPPVPPTPRIPPRDGTGAEGAVSSSPPGARQDGAGGAGRTPGDGAPSFDVVRVSPQGDTVIAGRAAPDAEVEVRIGTEVVGAVRADKKGEWVLVPEKPIMPGSHELTVTERLPEGREIRGTQTVVVVVPEQGRNIAGQPSGGSPGSLAVVLPAKKGEAPVVLQSPGGISSGALSLNAIDYGVAGSDLALSGQAPAGAEVRVYVDNDFIGSAVADDKGLWQLQPESDISAGLHRLRVDHTGESGKVVARVELPFSRAAPLRDLAEGTVIFVQPGNSLWRLARATYGDGPRYTDIFEANRDQIRDPDLIYPGQVFVLPRLN